MKEIINNLKEQKDKLIILHGEALDKDITLTYHLNLAIKEIARAITKLEMMEGNR